ncbi:DUF2290 domain-containing protein [Streptomyces sp. NPDC008259]|uniref:DUF2290 domain-containing protein n=1 Tax=Streptomyces TaxID=1883 RepID=UPI000D51635E|nr:hypothetical protein DBP15_14500 [Streptomyces sp. CS065A]
MTTPRSVRDDIVNFLDYLLGSDIAVFANTVSIKGARVSWNALDPTIPFLVNRGDPSLQDYRRWAEAGAYSALLFDGALLQITYDVEGGDIAGHRLAYIPCPYRLDAEMLRIDPILDVLDLHIESDPTSMVLHSAVRFDYDPASAAPGHPASHLTINSSHCRIACAAPMHVGRFADFLFRHFYADLWAAHRSYFSASATRHIGDRTLTEGDRASPHLMWN